MKKHQRKLVVRYWAYFSKVTMGTALALLLLVTTALHSFASGQEGLKISGTITSATDGTPMTGVNIVVKGTKTGMVSDINGHYEITVPTADATLIFSFVSYETQEISIGGQSTVNVVLKELAQALDEIVVIGYGSVKKKELTGAVASMKEKDFNQGVASNAMQLVQGKVAGLTITKLDGGDPTKGFEITLRGSTSIKAGQEPLIVIDGIPGGNLDAIAPDDIEAIDILKDGSSAAIYGTRGTNGVILVTTKKGKKGGVQVEYASRYFTESTMNKLEVLNRQEYLAMKDSFANSGNKALAKIASGMIDYGDSTDWYNEIVRNPFSQNQHLSLSGGGEKSSYRLSLDYLSQEGILLKSSKQEYKLGFNMQQSSMNDHLLFTAQLGLTDYKNHPVDYNAIRQTIQRNPTEPVHNPDGSLYEIIGAWQYDNPVGNLTERTRDDAGSRMFGNIGADLKITNDLKIGVIAGSQIFRDLNGYYQPSYSNPEESNARSGYANRSANANFTRTLETTLEWKKQLSNHFINLIGGYSFQDYTEEGFFGANSNFITDDVTYNNLGLGTWLTDGKADLSSYKRKTKLIGFFARGAYNFQGKYLFSASVRREGSTKFGKNNRWGIFPAASVAWDISKEDFMKNLGLFNFLKLRAGYGVTGNDGLSSDKNGFYAPLVLYGNQGVFYYNGAFTKGYGPISNPNPDLRWETKEEYNTGLDWEVLNSRLSGNIDYYVRDTKDLLELYDVPKPPNLYNKTWQNVGSMRNSGIEVSINATPIQKNDFKWSFTILFDHMNNKVLSLSSGIYSIKFRDVGEIGPPGITATTHRYEKNQPIGNIFGWICEGIDSVGKWKFKDYNPYADTVGGNPSDGKITADDRNIIGNGVPKYHLGFTNTFEYAGIDLSIMLRGMFDFQVINAKRIWHDNPTFLPRNILKTAMHSKLRDAPQFSSYYVEDGDFVKIDNITLGYTYMFKNKTYFDNVRIYGTCTNVMLITNYTGVDPEVAFKGLEPGNDNRFDYPSTRTFILGLNVKF